MSSGDSGAPRSVRSLALGILVRVARDRAHAAPLLDARGAGLPPRDRDLLRVLVKWTLRHALRLDHVLARSLQRPPESLEPAVREALRLGAAQLLLLDRIPKHAAVSETVAAVKEMAPRSAGLVNAVLRRVAGAEERPGRVLLPDGADAITRLALETSHPEWLVRRWVALFGADRARAALLADLADARIDLLADPRLGSREEVRDRLAAGGVETELSPWTPLALTVVSGDAAAHPLIAAGELPVVDAAAQAMAELVPPAPLVVDLAAAPGGKTRTLLARGTAARAVALERHPPRAARLARNLAASGRRAEAAVVIADATRPPLPRDRFASVLLDAPCSGTGTLRKNPEIGLRLRPEDLALFAAVQRSLLSAGLELLAPGGTLVYVTCSLEQEENDEVVAAALERFGEARRVSPPRDLLPVPLARALGADHFLRVPPGDTNDGFTAVVLRRDG